MFKKPNMIFNYGINQGIHFLEYRKSLNKIASKRRLIPVLYPSLEPRNVSKPIERETRKLSLLSTGLQVRIRPTAKQPNSSLAIHIKTEKRSRPTARHDSSTLSVVQCYHWKEKPLIAQARESTNIHRLRTKPPKPPKPRADNPILKI